jgi:hypothetical protein
MGKWGSLRKLDYDGSNYFENMITGLKRLQFVFFNHTLVEYKTPTIKIAYIYIFTPKNIND